MLPILLSLSEEANAMNFIMIFAFVTPKKHIGILNDDGRIFDFG